MEGCLPAACLPVGREYWKNGILEYWNDGMMEKWSDGYPDEAMKR